MLATGRLPADAIPGDLAAQDCILGMEVSGVDETGKRVMGLVPAKVFCFNRFLKYEQIFLLKYGLVYT